MRSPGGIGTEKMVSMKPGASVHRPGEEAKLGAATGGPAGEAGRKQLEGRELQEGGDGGHAELQRAGNRVTTDWIVNTDTAGLVSTVSRRPQEPGDRRVKGRRTEE